LAGQERAGPNELAIGSAAMSRILGPIRQLGYVVQNVETAMRHWVEIKGVSLWFASDNFALLAFH
jgi:hypothetical protein